MKKNILVWNHKALSLVICYVASPSLFKLCPWGHKCRYNRRKLKTTLRITFSWFSTQSICHCKHHISIWPPNCSSLSQYKVNQHIEKKVFVFCEITYIDASEFNDTRSLEACIWKKTELIYIFAYLTTFYFRFWLWASMTQWIAVKLFDFLTYHFV